MAKKPPQKPAAKPPVTEPRRIPAAASTGSTAVASLGLSEAEMLRDARSGMEGITSADLAIPRIAILQALSPQVDKRDDGYVQDAEAGDIIQNISNELYNGETGVLLVLVLFQKSHLEFKPERKGFAGNHGADPAILARTIRNEKTGAQTLPNGNEIVPVTEYFSFLVDEEKETWEPCVISFAKSMVKEARRFATVATSRQLKLPDSGKLISPALFYYSYRFRAVPTKNDKGSWFIWKFENGPATIELFGGNGKGRELYEAALGFRSAINAGKIKVADPIGESEHTGGSGNTASEAPM